MQLRYLKTILPPADSIQKVTSLTWSPNNGKLAAVTTDKVVYLFDESGEKRDKFKTKPADPNAPGSYIVRGMAFSPDSTKLAIAQSDNIVFIYRLGNEWTDKKSICNKFPQSSPVTCLTWPRDRHNEVVFGLAEGKVKLGMLKSNKPYTMYSHPDNSYVVSLAASPSGQAIISGHLDGSIYKFTFPEEEGAAGLGHAQLTQHSSVPYALGWGSSVAAAGNDSKIVFYDAVSGKEQQAFDFSNEDEVRDFASCEFNPAGDTAVFGTMNRFFIFSYSQQRGAWEQVGVKQIQNFYTVSALAWKPDGSRLSVGGLTGCVDVYDACVRRHQYKGKFEFTYVSKSSVIVKTIKTGARIVLKSVYGYQISGVRVYQDRFLVARTEQTLLLGDLDSCKLSEVPWRSTGGEKFYFENEKVCMIYLAGELTLVEYGSNEILGLCRTEHVSRFLVSVVLQEPRGTLPEAKKLACLVDLQTARVLDLGGGSGGNTAATINHDARIDWLELSPRAGHLLFRDKKRHLYLYDLAKQERSTLLNYCQYVQWVPGSDVIVAQSRTNMCIWYSLAAPDRVTMFPIKGEIEGIERTQTRIEVIVDEGINTVTYALDESLVDFGAALEYLDFERAVDVLQPLELTPETEAQWQQLAALALEHDQIGVAERCYAALGDVARARALHKVLKLAARSEGGADSSGGTGLESYTVRAQLAQLSKQWPVAESLLLAAGKVDAVIGMYQEAHKWEDAIRVADTSRHPDADTLKRSHYQWLLETAQEEKAATIKERDGDLLGSIGLYLKGGLPAKAAQVVMSHPSTYDPALLDSICAALGKAGLHEKAGDLYEHLNRPTEALQAYRRGHAYRKAVDLARRDFPSSVVDIEDAWGDWLVGQKQMDAAINHFIEAGQSGKAIEAAMHCMQYSKAAGIVEFLEPARAMPYYKVIARYYESTGHLEEAERFYIRADAAMAAVEMYNRAGKWEAAQKVARGYLTDGEVQAFYRQKAREFEAVRKYKEAERAYVQADEVDCAIVMYKKAAMYEPMLRLVGQHRKEELVQAHMLVAQACEGEGNLREAERHYCEAKDWRSAVHMYRTLDKWEDALRVAKVYGGVNASKQVAYAWAITLGGDAAGALLRKLGLAEGAVEYAVESGAFVNAQELARCAGLGQDKIAEVGLKYAMYLEDEGRFAEAEAEFISAGKPKEAIDMYIHNEDWDAASRVAEAHDPAAGAYILLAQAQVLSDGKQYGLAEAAWLRAQRPDAALQMYRGARMWGDALRLAEAYLPARVGEIKAEMATAQAAGAKGAGSAAGAQAVIARAQAYERGNDWARAIETYMQLGPGDSPDVELLAECWQHAVQLTVHYQRHRLTDVAVAAAGKLAEAGDVAAAAQLYQQINNAKGAAQLYCEAGMFQEARGVAAGNPALLKFVEEQYTAHLVHSQAADELAARGNASQAIDMYAAQGEWAKVYELAAKQGPDAIGAWAVRHARQKYKQRELGAAAAVLAQRGLTADPQSLELARGIALELLASGYHDRDPQAEQDMRDMLYRLLGVLASGASKQDTDDFAKLYWAAHLTAVANRSRQAGLHELAAKQLTALLRFAGIVPADKAFLEAGMAWKEAGRLNMAFVMLNRYLDLSDALDEPDSSAAVLENADFAATDVPYDFRLPQRPYADEDKREEARNFVLEVSMDAAVEQQLSTRPCDRCGAPCYEANLSCPSCKHRWEPCCVSGYPVLPAQRIEVQPGTAQQASVANREDWNAWVGKTGTDPLTGAAATARY